MFNTVRQKSGGFTIVELLIVIVVIGILAAIVIVAFNGVQERAREAAIQSDLRGFNTAMQAYKAEFGTYPSVPLASMGIKFTREMYGEDNQGMNARYCRNPTTDEYVILVSSTSKKYYKFTSAANKIEPNSATSGWGVCALVGLSSTNPPSAANGKDGNTWAAWVN